MDNGGDSFNFRLPPTAADKRPTAHDEQQAKCRSQPRSSAERQLTPFRTRERRPVSHSAVETRTFEQFTALLRTSSRNKNEALASNAPRAAASAAPIHRAVNSNRRLSTLNVSSDAERDVERSAHGVRPTRAKLATSSELLLLGSNTDSTPASTLKPSDLHHEVRFQRARHGLRDTAEAKREVQCGEHSPERAHSASCSEESSGDEEDKVGEAEYTTRLMNLYESMNMAQKIPQQVDVILEDWTDRHRNMKRRLSKIKFTVAKQKAQIERSEECTEKMEKDLQECKHELHALSLKCASLQQIIRDDKEKNDKELRELQERVSREVTSRTSTERDYEKVREELKYLQSHYEKEVSRRESCEKQRDSAQEELSNTKDLFSEKEREYKSRIELEEAKVSELSTYNDSVLKKVRSLEEIISESQTTIQTLKTESSNTFAVLISFHEWYENSKRKDVASLPLEALVQDLCQRHTSHDISISPTKMKELVLPTPHRLGGRSKNLQVELGAVLDHFRGVLGVYEKREGMFSAMIKEFMGSRERLEMGIAESCTSFQPMLVHIEKMKTSVKDGLTVLQSGREAVSKSLDDWGEQLEEVHASCQQALVNKDVEINRILAEQKAENERSAQNERRVDELTATLQQQMDLKEELSKKSHDLEVCRTVLAETRKDFAKVRQDAECLKISVEQKDEEIAHLKSSLQNQNERMRHRYSGQGRSTQNPSTQEDTDDGAIQRVDGLSKNSSVPKQPPTNRLKLNKKTSVRGGKISAVAEREKGREGTQLPGLVDNHMGVGVVDDEDWFEDQEKTRTLTERDIIGNDEKPRFSVRIPPRAEKKSKRTKTEADHCGIGKKRQKSGLDGLKPKRLRSKH